MKKTKIKLLVERIMQIAIHIEEDLAKYPLDMCENVIFSWFFTVLAYEEIRYKRTGKFYKNLKEAFFLHSALKHLFRSLITERISKGADTKTWISQYIDPNQNISQEEIKNIIDKTFDQREAEYEKIYREYCRDPSKITVGQIMHGIIENRSFFTDISKLFLENATIQNEPLPRELPHSLANKLKIYMRDTMDYIDADILGAKHFLIRLWFRVLKVFNKSLSALAIIRRDRFNSKQK